jgi:serine/threonine-protein kinase RsbW
MDKRPPIVIVDASDELRSALERALRGKGQTVVAKQEDGSGDNHGTSKIFLEFPSDLAFLEPVTGHLMKRIEQTWSMPAESCKSLAVALIEALVNAIKHGNHSDAAKLVRVTTEISSDQAKFTVEDEGPGFAVHDLPHPRDPENLFKTSGRGVLLIKSIMDETQYNGRGNCLIMIKRRASLLGPK